MTITRILTAVLLTATAIAGPAQGQFRMPPYSPPGQASAAIAPFENGGAESPVAPPPRESPADSLNRMTTPQPPAAASNPVGTVDSLMSPPGYPAGSYASPYFMDNPGCCGPVGRHGPVAYDIYATTGPSFAFGSGAFTDRLHLGWLVGGGARTLFFNKAGDAAWAVDLGVNFIYNRGSNDDFLNMFVRQPPLTGANNRQIAQPDAFETVRLKALYRTAFSFGIGRDWFIWGDGRPGGEDGWNLRIGGDVGGRWGTAHVDLIPFGDPSNLLYARRQRVFHGLYLDVHSNFEVPVGAWIFFLGSRAQWSYDWMDIVPPLKGDVQSINLLLTAGFRY